MNSKRAWIYCRVAYPDMASLDAQERYMIDYVKKQGFLIMGVTSEQGSGLDFSRKGIKTVSNAIEAGGVDTLFVKNLSRLGRDTEEVEVYLHWLKKHGVELVCADGASPTLYADMLHNLLRTYCEEYGGLRCQAIL